MKSVFLVQLSILAIQVLGQAPVAAPPPAPELNLPSQKIGPDDLLSVSVYDRPELTRTVRVSSVGHIDFPLLSEPIVALGLMPAELAKRVAERLTAEEILVQPVVSVAVVEYRSRPVSVVGAVRKPVTFQASTTMRLLDALARAEGLTQDAGTQILVTSRPHPDSPEVVRRVFIKDLIDQADPDANLTLSGGEQIRVPEAGKVFVVGNVRKPGAIVLHDGDDLTVLKVLALSEGLLPYSMKEAYVYRRDASGPRIEKSIALDEIVKRKSPDVVLAQDDILYIPDNKGRRLTLTTLDRIATFGSAASAAAIYGGVR